MFVLLWFARRFESIFSCDIWTSVYFFPSDIFLGDRDIFEKNAPDIKKEPVTIFGKMKIALPNFSKFSDFSNSPHVR